MLEPSKSLSILNLNEHVTVISSLHQALKYLIGIGTQIIYLTAICLLYFPDDERCI